MLQLNPQKLIDNFSSHLKNVIARGISLAAYLGKPAVSPLHLLVALSEEEGSVAFEILLKAQLNADTLRDHVLHDNSSKQTETRETHGKDIGQTLPELNPISRSIIEKALTLAYERSHNYIGTEHLLYGLLHSTDQELIDAFVKLKLNVEALEKQLESSLQNAGRFTDIEDVTHMLNHIEPTDDEQMIGDMEQHPIIPPPTNKKNKATGALAVLTTNLTDAQVQEKIDPVIGREREIERMIHILARRTKNNPILVGEPGVGKTAIVEGLAKKIAAGDVPDILRGKKILSLDLTLLVAGTIYRGEFEARLKQIIDECVQNPQYVLFIDELHNIIGAGSNQGTMDAANILKPALARGQLRCIGATTYEEYKKHITSDPALERRFQAIQVSEPTPEQTLAILMGVKKYYERYHHVAIAEKAIEKAVEYSNRYIHDNFQPDKAIDLLDEACGLVRTRQKPSPLSNKLFDLEKELDELTKAKEKAIKQEKLKEALGWKNKEAQLIKKIKSVRTQTTQLPKGQTPKVTEKDIAHVVSNRLQIDEHIITQTEWQNLSSLADRLNAHIVGQDDVIKTVVQTLKRSQLGMHGQEKPFASFLFAGPSGVGKTELAKMIAKELYHDEQALVRLDMSEFAESHSVSKLLGSPAGYVGYKDRNVVLDSIKAKPYSVLLFDEIDKAHGDVVKLLLQMLDEGTMRDSNGKKIYLRQSIIILTTNLGAEFFKSAGIGFGDTSREAHIKTVHNRVMSALKEKLGTPLVSRMDSVCMFEHLSEQEIERITEHRIEKVTEHLYRSQHIRIHTEKNALSRISSDVYKEDLGARPVERKVEELIHELMIAVLQKKKTKKQYTLSFEKDHFELL